MKLSLQSLTSMIIVIKWNMTNKIETNKYLYGNIIKSYIHGLIMMIRNIHTEPGSNKTWENSKTPNHWVHVLRWKSLFYILYLFTFKIFVLSNFFKVSFQQKNFVGDKIQANKKNRIPKGMKKPIRTIKWA